MRLPERYLTLDLSNLPYRIEVDETGTPITWKSTYGFVPHGFLAPGLYAPGNGDYCGFYWSVGKEDSEPIIGEIYHDSGVMMPVASSLEGLVRIKKLQGWSESEEADDEIIEKLDVNLDDLPLDESVSPSPESLLQADAKSPKSHVEAAKQALKQNDLDTAETHLKKALDRLPEYTDAHYHLASLYRRRRTSPVEAAKEMIATLTSPSVFLIDGKRKTVLQWLQRLHDEDYPDLLDDPIFASRKRLSLDYSGKQSDDFAIYEDAIDTYLAQGKGNVAVRLRVLVGELMTWQTQAFRERYGYSREKHNALLRDNLRQAGLESRMDSIRD